MLSNTHLSYYDISELMLAAKAIDAGCRRLPVPIDQDRECSVFLNNVGYVSLLRDLVKELLHKKDLYREFSSLLFAQGQSPAAAAAVDKLVAQMLPIAQEDLAQTSIAKEAMKIVERHMKVDAIVNALVGFAVQATGAAQVVRLPALLQLVEGWCDLACVQPVSIACRRLAALNFVKLFYYQFYMPHKGTAVREPEPIVKMFFEHAQPVQEFAMTNLEVLAKCMDDLVGEQISDVVGQKREDREVFKGEFSERLHYYAHL